MSHAIGVAGTTAPAASRGVGRRGWAWRDSLDSASAVGLGILILGAALFYVWQHVHAVRLGYEIERLRELKAARVQENKALTLELGRLRSMRRVEGIARTHLGMVTPKPGQVVILRESPIQ
jgi:cell division protein FtsL